jgi:flagellar biosynthesis protein FliQ
MRLGGPPLLAALAAGLLISLVQAITQVNEGTLIFLPKVIAVFAVLLVMGGAMFGVLDVFTRHIFDLLALAGGT